MSNTDYHTKKLNYHKEMLDKIRPNFWYDIESAIFKKLGIDDETECELRIPLRHLPRTEGNILILEFCTLYGDEDMLPTKKAFNARVDIEKMECIEIIK